MSNIITNDWFHSFTKSLTLNCFHLTIFFFKIDFISSFFITWQEFRFNGGRIDLGFGNKISARHSNKQKYPIKKLMVQSHILTNKWKTLKLKLFKSRKNKFRSNLPFKMAVRWHLLEKFFGNFKNAGNKFHEILKKIALETYVWNVLNFEFKILKLNF